MSKFMRVVMIILLIIAVVSIIVSILRSKNDNKYGNENPFSAEYYNNVTDVNLYPKSIENVDVKYVDEGALQGFHLTPKNKTHDGVVICYGGSEGSPNFETAERLAKDGYETLALFMFGMKNQPKTLARIPLEQFEDVLKYVEKLEDNAPITVVGASKGAEYALNLATKYDEIANLILIAPSAYNFAGLDFKDYGSSWTHENKELPFVDIKRSSLGALFKDMIFPSMTKGPIVYRESYASAVRMDANIESKTIPVEQTKANILMIVGEDDQMWDSYEMAKTIKARSENAQIVHYKNAGHIFLGCGVLNTPAMRVKTGGNLAGNNEADADSTRVIDEFLKTNHIK